MARAKKAPVPGEGRAEILAAALQEFSANGYSGASTSAIARRARVTQPLVYHHFKSKQALWDAVIHELFDALQAALSEAMAQADGRTRRERLALLLRTLVRFSGARPELSRLIRVESSGGEEGFAAMYDRWVKPLIAIFRREIAAGIDDGTLRPIDPRFAFFVIVGASTHPFAERATGSRAFHLDFAETKTIDAYADFVVDILMSGLLTPRAR